MFLLRKLASFSICVCVLSGFITYQHLLADDTKFLIGAAKLDITPAEPVRLSGYATRNSPLVGIADPISVRAMSILPAGKNRSESLVMVSYDGIGVTSLMTVEISAWLEQKYQIPRSQLVLCCTHSHATPHVSGGLKNLYRDPQSDEELAATQRYTNELLRVMRLSIDQAFDKMQPANLIVSEDKAGFAINRRLLRAGTWTGFGAQPMGPVDHRVRVMKAVGEDGKLLAAAFMYACHCTTLGGDFDQVSGDWAGLAASRLEQVNETSIFLPIIGCGADANPNPRGTYELAQQYAHAMADAVVRAMAVEGLPTLTENIDTQFGYAGLAPEHPTNELLTQRAGNDANPNEKRWAEYMMQVKEEMGRLPETYPMPIHTWKFGDQLTWVFLGGEVVLDYQLQLEKELPTEKTWVAAYTDDVFAYVASERMRAEGGYEVDSSMIYYLQPGRWQTGTQSLIVRRVREILEQLSPEDKPLTAEQALTAVHVPDSFRVELVAHEPTVQDPMNIAFSPDGKVWIVEMSDYPLGSPGGGRIKWLADRDCDGILDESHLFLSGLSYPTSVFPWRDGILYIEAPNVILASDQDGDGAADQREVLLSGVEPANPQHRASGFEIGLDGWLHFAAGHGTKQLHSSRNDVTYDVSGRDVAWNPDTGEIRTTSGETQFVRARDPFGVWFGNSNSKPMYQYVIEDRYLKGNSIAGGPSQDLLRPGVAPPVYPRSRTVDRFNDLYALNRFTSACSAIISRSPGISSEDEFVGLICEPVHNLVSRIELSNIGCSLSAVRHPDDKDFDFLASTDSWSRPVRVINAPDGSIWVLDMVRQVIEHPEWIPTAWQERLNLRGGENLGRIYRVYKNDFSPQRNLDIGDLPSDWITALASPIGARRDLALARIMQSEDFSLRQQVERLAVESQSDQVRASALGALASKQWLTLRVLSQNLNRNPRLTRWVIELLESEITRPQDSSNLAISDVTSLMGSIARANQGPSVDLQWILTVSRLPVDTTEISEPLSQIVARNLNDIWFSRAVSLINNPVLAFSIAQGLIDDNHAKSISATDFEEQAECFCNLWKISPADPRAQLLNSKVGKILNRKDAFQWQDLIVLSAVARFRQELTGDQQGSQLTKVITNRALATDTNDVERVILIRLMFGGLLTNTDALELSKRLLGGDQPPVVQQSALESMRSLRDDSAASTILDSWASFTPGLRRTASATLLTRGNWINLLLAALEEERVGARDIDPASVQILRSYRDRNLRSRAEDIFGKPTPRAQIVAKYVAEMPAPTKSAQAEELFRNNCAACHATESGKASPLGPSIDNLGHWTLDQWVTAVMDPNQAVEGKYTQTSIVTLDGQIISGIIEERSTQDLRLALSDGSRKQVRLADVESLQETNRSLMPEGFEEKLSPTQLAEIIGWLRSSRP
ncbi:MAG: neutral/alkaline non-lysosomal ceramidase N-terminal domain-containing protein [Planctomycetales bacterium]|nr:neutral/alkaline non-lysosomal ceramidase N-terminal domain-containing protein [Planctomycetales bacterium]